MKLSALLSVLTLMLGTQSVWSSASAAAVSGNFTIATVVIHAGSFVIGSPGTEINRFGDEVQVPVQFTQDFEIGKTVVTQLQWWSVMGNNPSNFSKRGNCPNSYVVQGGIGICPDFPVEMVTWDDVQNFITKINSQGSQYEYRLPTEAEWEYAARAGTQTAYFFGNDPRKLDLYTWNYHNSGGHTHAVATKPANPWGLYDVHGNVWQWVQDWYGQRSSYPMTDPVGPSSGTFRVLRGGSFTNLYADDYADNLRSAVRGIGIPEKRYYNLGFRLVRTLK